MVLNNLSFFVVSDETGHSESEGAKRLLKLIGIKGGRGEEEEDKVPFSTKTFIHFIYHFLPLRIASTILKIIYSFSAPPFLSS